MGSSSRAFDVELYSATDPVYMPDRRVWYWVETPQTKSVRTENYVEAKA
jgi:hypothetical protein